MGDAKTKSAPKNKATTVIIRRVGIILAVLAVIVFLTSRGSRPTHLIANGHDYRLLVAATQSQQETGLGARSSLPQDEGMLFPSPRAGKQCFWMKGMFFSLDIVWADNAKKVTHIEKNVSPSTYPHAFCADGQYVIELNAGQAGKSHLVPGQQLQF